MSKASQRKEAARQKRMKEELGLNPTLLRALRTKGPFAMDDPWTAWSILAELKGTKAEGTRHVSHADEAALHQLMEDYRVRIENLAALESAGLLDEFNSDPLVGIVYLDSLKKRKDSSLAVPLSVGMIRTPGDPIKAAESLFDRMDDQWSTDGCDALLWVFGLPTDERPIFCFGCSRSGAIACRVLLRGKWIHGKNPTNLWGEVASVMAESVLEAREGDDDEDGVGSSSLGALVDAEAEIFGEIKNLCSFVAERSHADSAFQVDDQLFFVDKSKTFALIEAIHRAYDYAQQPYLQRLLVMSTSLDVTARALQDALSNEDSRESEAQFKLRQARERVVELEQALQKDRARVDPVTRPTMPPPDLPSYQPPEAHKSLATRCTALFVRQT